MEETPIPWEIGLPLGLILFGIWIAMVIHDRRKARRVKQSDISE